MTLRPEDLVIETYSAGIFGHRHIRITHVPSRLVVEGTGHSTLRLREELLDELRDRLTEQGP
jgi:protein subunit release factor A